MIPYSTGDYKKYVYAQGKLYISRIREIIQTLCDAHRLNREDTDDLDSLLHNAVEYLWLAAFVDDHRQADAAQQPRPAWARVNGWAEPDPELERARKAVDIYDDGRTVTTTVRFGDGEDEYATHVWHPDPLHPDNRPGAVIEFSQGPYPFRFRYLIVTAPGIIDTYEGDEEEPPR
jgi:hypothetical protein